MARNKASGPDGLPNEFLRAYWPLLKSKILALFNEFFHGRLNMLHINKANITMIPKKDGPQTVEDFRPISVINLFPKLISKVLATQLAGKLSALISTNQTVFMAGRHIAENFIATREILQHINESGCQALFMKIDFAKAFDSVD
jgi:Reverse transcriptase (RNA-dependent DNA polymerase)